MRSNLGRVWIRTRAHRHNHVMNSSWWCIKTGIVISDSGENPNPQPFSLVRSGIHRPVYTGEASSSGGFLWGLVWAVCHSPSAARPRGSGGPRRRPLLGHKVQSKPRPRCRGLRGRPRLMRGGLELHPIGNTAPPPPACGAVDGAGGASRIAMAAVGAPGSMRARNQHPLLECET